MLSSCRHYARHDCIRHRRWWDTCGYRRRRRRLDQRTGCKVSNFREWSFLLPCPILSKFINPPESSPLISVDRFGCWRRWWNVDDVIKSGPLLTPFFISTVDGSAPGCKSKKQFWVAIVSFRHGSVGKERLRLIVNRTNRVSTRTYHNATSITCHLMDIRGGPPRALNCLRANKLDGASIGSTCLKHFQLFALRMMLHSVRRWQILRIDDLRR